MYQNNESQSERLKTVQAPLGTNCDSNEELIDRYCG